MRLESSTKLFLTGLIRGVIPFVILLIMSLWTRLQGSVETSNTFLVYSVIAFFLGLTSIIYQFNEWSFRKQITAHYGAVLITVFPTLLFSGFYPLNSFADLLSIYLNFNITGIMLFFITYFLFKLVNSVRTE
ncbi:DUF3021 family protein [Rossellomorea vietnamensis]|uniref:DUF3021 domain-containing protein n=1 Tax=Rossellomorea aquimaris TaxID=189382 RepID=A0A5D4TJY5_9BACI|nr:DUF3021 domain-containing protein [Rossellomorea aquimaris]